MASYTVDANDSVQQSLAVRAGRINYVGNDAGLAEFLGPKTQVVDLKGRMLMPGLVDGHMHPIQGGGTLLMCNLNYVQLNVAQMQAKIQACLDQSRAHEPDDWLQVVNWFQEGMVPAGTHTNRATLDALQTQRPIIVLSSFGHTALVNSRGLKLAGVGAKMPDPLGGRIGHDAAGEPSGILEDAAQEAVIKHIPAPTAAGNAKAAQAALGGASRARHHDFSGRGGGRRRCRGLRHHAARGQAHRARAFCGADHAAAGQRSQGGRRRGQSPGAALRSGRHRGRPALTVRNVKLFLNGVITAPASTGAMLTPYLSLQGAPAHPHWAPSKSRGPDVYFPAPILSALLIDVADAASNRTCMRMAIARYVKAWTAWRQ